MFQRFLPYLLAAAHLSLWGAGAMTLRTIEVFPDHFDLAGKPDAWTTGPWWVMPLLALALTLVLLGALLLARRLTLTSPQWVNLPRKLDWLALPPDARLRAFKPAEGLLLGLATFMNLTFISIVLDSYAVASGAKTGLSSAKLIVVLVCMLVWLALSIVRIRQAIGDEVRAARRLESEAGSEVA